MRRSNFFGSERRLGCLTVSDFLQPESSSNLPRSMPAKYAIQIAYDEITARYPALYSYPPCYGTRPSSTTLVGELMQKDNIDVAQVEALAVDCGNQFCFALVGNKIATLCPAE